ncbi:MAG: leucyl aminopeptidase [Alphaproteobacteria bacterium]
MKIVFAERKLPGRGALIVTALDGKTLGRTASGLDRSSRGAIGRAMAASRFAGKCGEILVMPAIAGIDAAPVVLVGLGKPEEFDLRGAEKAGAEALAAVDRAGAAEASFIVDRPARSPLDVGTMAARIGLGAKLRHYRFDKYLTRQKPEEKSVLARFAILSDDPAAAKRAHAPLIATADAVYAVRDLVSEPSNIIFPRSFAGQARKLARLGVKVEVLGRKAMQDLGMGALLGVAQGSDHEPQLVVMRWNGDRRAKAEGPVALIGKGVTFDSGGISIKPAQGMEDMKWDMAGAAAVYGAVHALAARRAKVNVVGLVGLVENMPSGTAQRPGDIVHSHSGQTIEVINTDAEGRLVLADVMSYCQARFKPRAMVDLATLTGAIIIALGDAYAGMFSTDDALADRLAEAGKAVGERVWRMPLDDSYDELLKSEAADMRNVTRGREAGSATAAQFLKRFVNKGVPWAHLDIAGVAWSKKDKASVPAGATAWGVRLLEQFVAKHFERR